MTRLSRSLGVVLAGSFVLAACGGGSASSATPPPGSDASIDARQNAFAPREVHVAADTPQQLFFRDLDPVPHNVAVYRDGSYGEALFSGTAVTDAATVYELPALPAGTYPFRCDIHPEMTGTLIVG